MKRDGKRGEMRDVGAAGECWGRVGSGHAFGHELFARFFGLGTMYRASPPTRTTTTTADSARGTAGRSHSRTRLCFGVPVRQATMSPAEADLRPSLVAVAGPSPQRAHASSQGQATMSCRRRCPSWCFQNFCHVNDSLHIGCGDEPRVRGIRVSGSQGIVV